MTEQENLNLAIYILSAFQRDHINIRVFDTNTMTAAKTNTFSYRAIYKLLKDAKKENILAEIPKDIIKKVREELGIIKRGGIPNIKRRTPPVALNAMFVLTEKGAEYIENYILDNIVNSDEQFVHNALESSIMALSDLRANPERLVAEFARTRLLAAEGAGELKKVIASDNTIDFMLIDYTNDFMDFIPPDFFVLQNSKRGVMIYLLNGSKDIKKVAESSATIVPHIDTALWPVSPKLTPETVKRYSTKFTFIFDMNNSVNMNFIETNKKEVKLK